jgi:hypothetical protein
VTITGADQKGSEKNAAAATAAPATGDQIDGTGAINAAQLAPPPQLPSPSSFWDGFWRTVSSGLFFMAVGCVFLVVAAYTMGETHSSLSFVLVVVGVAILLYGTGTQGMGQLDSHVGTAKYKVAVAGGAGALAFGVEGRRHQRCLSN